MSECGHSCSCGESYGSVIKFTIESIVNCGCVDDSPATRFERDFPRQPSKWEGLKRSQPQAPELSFLTGHGEAKIMGYEGGIAGALDQAFAGASTTRLDSRLHDLTRWLDKCFTNMPTVEYGPLHEELLEAGRYVLLTETDCPVAFYGDGYRNAMLKYIAENP